LVDAKTQWHPQLRKQVLPSQLRGFLHLNLFQKRTSETVTISVSIA
jgi:hypothetical protein